MKVGFVIVSLFFVKNIMVKSTKVYNCFQLLLVNISRILMFWNMKKRQGGFFTFLEAYKKWKYKCKKFQLNKKKI